MPLPALDSTVPTVPDFTPFTLADFAAYAKRIEAERGFDGESLQDKCMLLTEEVGELMKAIRKHHTAIKTAADAAPQNVAEELADVFSYVLHIANKTGTDLAAALRDKELKNLKRSWS
jgi:NTP pyrophosphatase (non-canonical NTP hydrolase)